MLFPAALLILAFSDELFANLHTGAIPGYFRPYAAPPTHFNLQPRFPGDDEQSGYFQDGQRGESPVPAYSDRRWLMQMGTMDESWQYPKSVSYKQHPFQRLKRFIKQTGSSGRYVPKNTSPATAPISTTSSPMGRSMAGGRPATTKKPTHRPPMMAAAVGGRSSYAEGEEDTVNQPPPPPPPAAEGQMGRSMPTPSPPQQQDMRGTPLSPSSEPQGRAMPPPPPVRNDMPGGPPPSGGGLWDPPLQSNGLPAPTIFSSLEFMNFEARPQQNPKVDDTDGAILDIGIDIAATLCALQDEFDATGTPPRRTFPEPGSKYSAKYKTNGSQGCHAFKWTPCQQRGSRGKPCGWYELAAC